MVLIVCPAASAAEICREADPSHVLSLGSPGNPPTALPDGVARLSLAFNDVAAPSPGLVAPDREMVAAMLRFGRSWDGTKPFLVHCEAGISRSTAAAFALACQAAPGRPESAIASRLRQASATATPNPLVVALADALLGRQGRMTMALAAIGRGADYAPYRSFALQVDS